MKKFGTPSGAGPGTEYENVGLADVGTPALLLLLLVLDGFGAGLDCDWGFGLGLGAGFGLGFGFELDWGFLEPGGGELWCEGGCEVPVLVVRGGGCWEVEVDVVGVEVVGVELVRPVDVVLVGVDVVGVEVEVEVVLDDGVHDTLSIVVPGWG